MLIKSIIEINKIIVNENNSDDDNTGLTVMSLSTSPLFDILYRVNRLNFVFEFLIFLYLG